MTAFLTGTYGHTLDFDVGRSEGEFVATLPGAPSIRGKGGNPREALHRAVEQVMRALAPPAPVAVPTEARALAESIREHAVANTIRDEELVAYIAARLQEWQGVILAHGDGLGEQLTIERATVERLKAEHFAEVNTLRGERFQLTEQLAQVTKERDALQAEVGGDLMARTTEVVRELTGSGFKLAGFCTLVEGGDVCLLDEVTVTVRHRPNR
jgi:hypothetical protein